MYKVKERNTANCCHPHRRTSKIWRKHNPQVGKKTVDVVVRLYSWTWYTWHPSSHSPTGICSTYIRSASCDSPQPTCVYHHQTDSCSCVRTRLIRTRKVFLVHVCGPPHRGICSNFPPRLSFFSMGSVLQYTESLSSASHLLMHELVRGWPQESPDTKCL